MPREESHLKVFYRPEQNAETDSYSPSASKPAKVVQHWLESNCITPEDVVSFAPLTKRDLAYAHSKDYVEGIFDGFELNGFQNTDREVAESTLYTCGSMYHAAVYALKNGGHHCSPTSGFHHAHFDRAEGFCTFNGLMITAAKLKAEGLINMVAIIDCDFHHGNGTEDIIDYLNADWVQHHTAGAIFNGRKDGVDAEFARWLIRATNAAHKADLILYQAGADPHIMDPLGGFMSSKQIVMRDMLVAKALKDKPVVWNLAGGYQRDDKGSIKPVIKIHTDTLRVFKNGSN